jgi:hypothetical protein
MSATATHDLCVKTGEYTDRSGENKGRWLTIGTVFRHAHGGSWIKLNCFPIGVPDWSGWVSVFKREPKEGAGQQASQNFQAPDQNPRNPNSAASGSRGMHRQQAAPVAPAEFDDDIPF